MSEKELDAMFETVKSKEADAATIAEIERLKAENAGLKERLARAVVLTLRISEKGGISVYGMGRFPVTLYYENWVKVCAMGEVIEAFYQENKAEIDRRSSITRAAKKKEPIEK